jgi:hypothetical protein
VSGDWFKRKFEWLESVAADPALRGLPVAIAVKLAWRYLNAETQDAWPKVSTLAAELNADPRSVQRALDRLVAAGKLSFERGGRGPRDTNRYRIKGGTDATLKKRVASTPKKGGVHAGKRVAYTPPESTSDNPEGARESPRLRRDSLCTPRFSSSKATDRPSHPAARAERSEPTARADLRSANNHSGNKRSAAHRQGKAQPLPQDWVIGNAELAIARTVAGWDLPTAEDEFAKFKDWHAHRASQSANWPAAWQTWCRRGREYASKQRPVTGLRSGLLGVQQWLDEQKRKQSKR